jgi:hypothetical protein
MNIIPFIHRQAPELCYFTLNGVRFTEKPMLGKQVDWYKVITSKKALHPIAEIRAKHFKKALPVKIGKVEVVYPSGFEYLNKTYNGVVQSYKNLLEQIKTTLTKKHNLDGLMTYEKWQHDDVFTTEKMPVPTIKITTKLIYK